MTNRKIIFSPENIMISLLNYFPMGNNKFPNDREKIHTAFYNLRKQEPKLLEEFCFNTFGTFPKSSELDCALTNLEYCRFLSYDDCSYNGFKNYVINPVVHSYFSEKLGKKLAKHIPRLKSLSEMLQRELKAEAILSV